MHLLVLEANHHAEDLEDTCGLTSGQIYGELALDQFFTMRPLLDWAYRTLIRVCTCAEAGAQAQVTTLGAGARARSKS
jgi:hypothetical protein